MKRRPEFAFKVCLDYFLGFFYGVRSFFFKWCSTFFFFYGVLYRFFCYPPQKSTFLIVSDK